ncbi:MAG: hypothetical protein GEU90_02850 [Gemmatimonas sp.]|nr:hypothetical protein [Gemmatimonas sp.]
MEANAVTSWTDTTTESLEGALAHTERDAELALRAESAVHRELKRVRNSAVQGALKDLRKSLAEAEQLADALRESVRVLRAGWTFDERTHLESGAYTTELLGVAREQGVKLFEQDERILSYPSLVRLLPGEAAVEIDRKREKRIRPSVLAELLGARQQKPPRFKPEPFLEALLRAYRLALPEKKGRAMGSTVSLLEIYQILTLFPGSARDYTKQEFARDIYLVDQSGVRTREGLRVSFPAATGTKSGGTLSTVTREGELKVYYGVAFRP